MQKINQTTNFSFWENQTYFNDIDLIVIGSGIVGLSAAIAYKEKFKKSKVVVLEKGLLPCGASTKNAGFACFGSVSELLSDLKKNGENTVWQTVEMRIKGLELLKKRLGEKQIDFKELGGYELFDKKERFDECAESIDSFNKTIKAFTGIKNTYCTQHKKIKSFEFNSIQGLILNKKEGQIDTGKMMKSLIEYASNKGIIILNSISVSKIDVKPARAQVLITKPITNLKIKGTFHYDEGYYYFRNIGSRVLFGGGRNLDFKHETTTEFMLNPVIQNHLDKLLKTVILPNTPFEVEQRWCGIMGVGEEKKPIIKKISSNIVCAVRMGGMGVAIGSLVGKLAVDELT